MRGKTVLIGLLVLLWTGSVDLQTRFPGRFTSAASMPTIYSPWTLPDIFIPPAYSLPSCTDIDVGVTPTGGCKNITVDSGQNLQTALEDVRCDGSVTDMITIQEYGGSVTFQSSGNGFEIQAKSGCNAYVYIVSSGHASLPATGNRLVPSGLSDTPAGMTGNTSRNNLARIIAGPADGPFSCFMTEAGASYVRFVGIECLGPPDDQFTSFLWRFSMGTFGEADTEAEMSHHMVIDRSFIHGDATVGAHAGLLMFGENIAIVDSYISGIFTNDNNETQAILCYGGSQYLSVFNTYLEAVGENVMCAGAAAFDSTRQVSDAAFIWNYFYKQLAWKAAPSTYGVKNCFELKSGARVLVYGNVMEHSWVDDQDPCISLKIGGELPVDEDTDDITIIYNKILKVANFLRQCAQDCASDIPNQMGRIYYGNNLVYQVDKDDWGSGGTDNGTAIRLFSSTENFIYDHNTVINDANCTTTFIQGPGSQYAMVWRDSICVDAGVQPMTAAICTGANGSCTLTGNVFIGNPACPSGNSCPATIAAVEFEDADNFDYRLAAGSDYKAACSDVYGAGTTDCGANVTAINQATTCAISGQCAGVTFPTTAPAPMPVPMSVSDQSQVYRVIPVIAGGRTYRVMRVRRLRREGTD